VLPEWPTLISCCHPWPAAHLCFWLWAAAAVCQTSQCPTSTHFRRQTNEQTDRHRHHINPFVAGLNNNLQLYLAYIWMSFFLILQPRQSVQQRLIPDLESRLRRRCETLVSFHTSSQNTSSGVSRPTLTCR